MNSQTLLAFSFSRKTERYRDYYSEHWNPLTPFEDAVWVYLDAHRILQFSYVLEYYLTIDESKEAAFVGFLIEDLKRHLGTLHSLLVSEDITHEAKEKIKRAGVVCKGKADALVATAQEGLAATSDLFRLSFAS